VIVLVSAMSNSVISVMTRAFSGNARTRVTLENHGDTKNPSKALSGLGRGETF
jgi:hypothetical protein